MIQHVLEVKLKQYHQYMALIRIPIAPAWSKLIYLIADQYTENSRNLCS